MIKREKGLGFGGGERKREKEGERGETGFILGRAYGKEEPVEGTMVEGVVRTDMRQRLKILVISAARSISRK